MSVWLPGRSRRPTLVQMGFIQYVEREGPRRPIMALRMHVATTVAAPGNIMSAQAGDYLCVSGGEWHILNGDAFKERYVAAAK